MPLPLSLPEPDDSPAIPTTEEQPAPSSSSEATQIALHLARQAVQQWTPRPVRAAVRRTIAEATARALDVVPLPLYELLKLRSLDPFVARATTPSHETTGYHFLVMSGVPMMDSGGGQRAAQFALELLSRNHRVTFVHRFKSGERSRTRKTFAHENLTQARFRDFSARRFVAERSSYERIVGIVEFPLPEYLSAARYMRRAGATMIYDCIDAWDTELGYGWYTRRTEDALARECDFVVASAKALQNTLTGRAAREVALVPNAVNTRLFKRGKRYDRPAQLPQKKPIFLYVGALWGAWFDWDWIRALAAARPDAAIVLVGDYRGECGPTPPPNLHFTGLRPQSEIPAFLQHSDVTLIPFRLDKIVEAVSPLKVFEYLAMGKPVVASAMPELEGMPGVRIAKTVEEFVIRCDEAVQDELTREDVATFVAANSWTARVKELERMLGITLEER